MMKILLSIKPEYAEKILKGDKGYEFRRTLPKRFPLAGKTVVIYACRPIGKIIGEFSIETVISGHPDRVWNETKDQAGINWEYFDRYFSGHSIAHAIKVKQVWRYKEVRTLSSILGHNRPPQSFCYLAPLESRRNLPIFFHL